jgi:hypothetical protein
MRCHNCGFLEFDAEMYSTNNPKGSAEWEYGAISLILLVEDAGYHEYP